ncbi:hypothetical protein Tco_0668723 [Tanacetum coccineum]
MGSITKEPPQGELGSIRRLGTLREILIKAKTKDQGLLYTGLMVNDKKMLGLIDASATHNFLDITETERLGLKCIPEEGKIKSVNSQPKQILGIAKEFPRRSQAGNKKIFYAIQKAHSSVQG